MPRAARPSISSSSTPRVDDHAVGDHRDAAGGQDARGQQVGGELLAVDDDGVPGVVSALIADAIIDGRPRAGRSPCLCLRRPTGLRAPRSRACAHPSTSGHVGLCRPVIAKHATSPDAQQHRGSCEPTLSEVDGLIGGVDGGGRAPAPGTLRLVEPMLLITNSEAGSADERAARGGARGAAGGHRRRGGHDREPRRARRRAAPARRPPGRGRRRRRQPARGDRRAAPAPRARRHRRGAGAAGHRQRLRPRHRHPARPGGGGRGGGDRAGPAGRPDRRLPRRGGRQQRPHRRRRPGLPQRHPSRRCGPRRLRARGR